MRRIGVLARWPEPGRVKTRLSPALPPPLACALHRAMLDDALEAALAAPADERVLFWADAPADRGDVRVPAALVTRDQSSGDLGARLTAAFAALLPRADDRAAIIGSDCPGLTGDHLARALAALADHDVAIGPSRDGGYHLVALARPEPALFRDVDWGTERVLEQTLARARAAGLRVATLATLDDLDTPADLVRFIAAADAGGGRRTRAALAAMGLLPDALAR